MATSSRGIVLSFVELHVSDWLTAVRWYVEVLGLQVLVQDPVGQFALLTDGEGRFALKAKAGNDCGGVRLVFRVPDVEVERQHMLERGVAVSEIAENEREGYREIRLHAPEGTPITLFSWCSSPGR